MTVNPSVSKSVSGRAPCSTSGLKSPAPAPTGRRQPLSQGRAKVDEARDTNHPSDPRPPQWPHTAR